MKRILSAFLLSAALLSTTACGGSDNDSVAPRLPEQHENPGTDDDQKEENPTATMRMNITVGNRTVTATMEDNVAARDLLSRLPLEVTLEDYNNVTEKIFYPSPALDTEGVARGCTPSPGDITIYAPWNNVAIFCKSWSHSDQLIRIGRIDGDGIEALNVPGDVEVLLERR